MQRSGLPRLPSHLRPKDPANPYADYDEEKLKTFLAGYELSRDPGASFEYSNLAFGLLGYALAKSASTTYAALLDETILCPLGKLLSAPSHGKVAVIEFYRRELPVGPPLWAKLSEDEAKDDFLKGAFKLDKQLTFLPYQYFLIFTR
jgi:CubicO group peptidase (beta-lactamase class C family)